MEYETQAQHQQKSIPDEAAGKLGSAQPDSDPLDATGAAPAGIPVERIAADVRPVDVRPREFVAVDTRPNDFMTPETRPRDIRPRDIAPS